MKTLYLVRVLSLLVVSLVPAGALAQTGTVAAWNIEGFAPVTAAKAKRVARAIHNLKPDIIALVEMNPNAAAVTVVNELGTLGDHYSMRILNQTASQNIALVQKRSERHQCAAHTRIGCRQCQPLKSAERYRADRTV